MLTLSIKIRTFLRIKIFTSILCIISICNGCSGYTTKQKKVIQNTYSTQVGKINVCFTPPSGCGSLIAEEIAKAKNSIYVQAYGFTFKPIIEQLVAARRRGVNVKVILDGGNLSNNQEMLNFLKTNKIWVAMDIIPSGIAHNKVMIIDERFSITGSFNFTTSADKRNAENVLVINDKRIAKLYLKNWLSRANIAVKKQLRKQKHREKHH